MCGYEVAWDTDASGLRAWFEMELAPSANESWQASLWARLCDERKCDALFEASLQVDQPDMAAAAVVGALVAIWQEGRDLDRIECWDQRAHALIAEGRGHGLALASVAVHAFTARWMWRTEVVAQLAALPALREVVDRANSDALRILAAASEAYVLLMAGELNAARECVCDAGYFAPDPGEAVIPKLHLAGVGALVDVFSGQYRRAAKQLAALLERPDASQWPLHLKLTLRGHLLMGLAESGDLSQVRQAAEDLRSLAIPGNRAYQRSYLHYGLGAGALLAGQAAEALAHARAAVYIGRLSGSLGAQLIPALLEVQALIDLHRNEEAQALLDACEPRWSALGMRLQLAAGRCERAALWQYLGERQKAHDAWVAAGQTLPVGERLPVLHRRQSFLVELDTALAEPDAPTGIAVGSVSTRAAVQIRTLGGFGLSVAGRPIPDSQWKGTRVKTLLKLILALGAMHVPVDRLADALWPDADGARARANLKVLVWRLRHLGTADGAEPPPWLTLGKGEVSIDPALCEVDALRLSEAARSQSQTDWTCMQLLRSCGGDFLPNDEGIPFVAQHREKLQRDFAQVAVRCARLLHPSADEAAMQELIASLQQALAQRPHDEHCALWLMSLLMRQGRQAEALSVFAEIRGRLAHDLGLASPGEALCALRDEVLAGRPVQGAGHRS